MFASCLSSAEDSRETDCANALPVLKADASRLPERQKAVWANIELRGKLMTGTEAYSDTDVAKHATTIKLSARAEKMLV
jgi:hypothetical protein